MFRLLCWLFLFGLNDPVCFALEQRPSGQTTTISNFAGEQDLPSAPNGYSWKSFESIRAWFLVPNGWFVKEERKGGTQGVFISKESIEKEGLFKTGFTANVVLDFLKKNQLPPSQYARQYIAQQLAVPTILESWGVGAVGAGSPVSGYGAFMRVRSPNTGNRIVERMLALGNDRTGKLYLFSFESPESEWASAVKVGTIMMDKLVLDPDF